MSNGVVLSVVPGFLIYISSIVIVDLSVVKEVIAEVYCTPVIRMSCPLTVHDRGFLIAVDTSVPHSCRKSFGDVRVTVYGIVILKTLFAGISPRGSIVNVYLLGCNTLPDDDAIVKV